MAERDVVRWLQLTYKVPSEPSQKRVWVWRRLQNLGAYALQNSVYLLPFSEEVEKYFPGFLAFIDSSEQQIPRPVNNNKRKMYYSGKKKRYTVKNQIMVNNRGYILHNVGYKKGRKHDYDIYKRNHPVTPKEVVNVFDLGYLGVEKDFPKQLSSLPNRKNRNQKISEEERCYNKDQSKRRIVIEHIICRLKKYRILADVFRNRLRKYNKVTDIVSGLINYRIIKQVR